MTPLAKIAIVLIALAVVIVGAVVIYVRSLVRTRRERRTNQHLRVEEEERERLFCSMTGNELAATNRSRERFGLPPWPAKEDAPIQPAIPQDKIIADWKGRLAAAKDRERDDDTKTGPGPEAMA